MSAFVFRRLDDKEALPAYEILRERSVWEKVRGIQQESELLPLADFQRRQELGQNFGLFSEGWLVSTVCLKREPTVDVYAAWMNQGECWWVCALASHPSYAGRNIGKETMRLAEAYLKGRGASRAYLECGTGTGFLPCYYASQGWRQLGKIMSDEGFSELVEVNLFVKDLG